MGGFRIIAFWGEGKEGKCDFGLIGFGVLDWTKAEKASRLAGLGIIRVDAGSLAGYRLL